MNRFLPAATAALVCACGHDPAAPVFTPLPPAQIASVAPSLGAMAFALATAGEGHSFFDNHLSCVRRGVVTYVNDDAGRVVTFHGCQVADDIVLDGTGRIRWAETSAGPTHPRFCATGLAASCLAELRWEGSLLIGTGAAQTQVTAFTVSSIVAADRVANPSIGLVTASVVLGDSTAAVTGASLFDAIFDTTGITLSTLPNAGGSLTALTDADLARLAHHLGMDLGALLLDETLEAARGNHAHTLPCGTTTVTIDGAQLPHLANDWTSCTDRGLVIDGDFTMQWGRFEIVNNQPGVIRMDLAGDFTIGGGVPATHLTSLRWTVSGNGGLPGRVSIVLELTGPGGTRTWQASVDVDD